jgi:signal transduction histidine kinase
VQAGLLRRLIPTDPAAAVGADGDDLLVEVTDDGVGLPADPVPGVGSSSMRERAAEMGGECRVEPAPGGGTAVLARLPRTAGG